MLLDGKVAVIYGASGAIGGAVARAFAREGAHVHVSARRPVDDLALEITAAGGVASAAVVDAVDEAAVDAWVDDVAAREGRVDISFNLITHGDVQGTPLVDMAVGDVTDVVATAVRTQFLTTRAAARHMIQQRSGVILAFGGTGRPAPNLGGLCVAFDAVEGLRRQWSVEFGPYGVRFVTLKTGGVPESIPDTADTKEWRSSVVAEIEDETLLGRTATLQDVGDVAAFVASDRARTMTAATVNISAGALIDY
jgi:NAD(P)-dependent dehydrogenase (short-subunit alcohol dehydrogenase family)